LINSHIMLIYVQKSPQKKMFKRNIILTMMCLVFSVLQFSLVLIASYLVSLVTNYFLSVIKFPVYLYSRSHSVHCRFSSFMGVVSAIFLLHTLLSVFIK